jgi:type IV pilus assembly protein PilW
MVMTSKAEWAERRRSGESGLTLVELMISMVIGMLVVLVATALVVSGKSAYVTQDEEARLEETGRYALDLIARAVRQTAYENWDSDGGAIQVNATASSNIRGLDARTLKETTEGIDGALKSSVNGSDVLSLRFFGAGAGEHGDGSMLNCAGFGVPGRAPDSASDDGRGWSIFYVAKESTGEPALYCKYRGAKSFATAAIASGVESFQVLYGMDIDGDGVPNRYVTATEADALDDALVLTGADDAARALDRNRKSWWKKIVVLKVALLLRGGPGSSRVAGPVQFDLFGKDYGDAHARSDAGTRVKVADLSGGGNRLRKIFSQTIWLHNRTAGGTT